MDWPITLAATALLAGLTAFCGWRGARPPDLRKGPRLMPWRFLMILFAAATMLMVVHVLNLAGVKTGR